MKKQKIVMLKGLPASGKSTRSRIYTEGGFYRVNKDDIRSMLFGDNYKKKHEKQVIWTRDSLIQEALKRGKSVVVDDTNLNPVHEKTFRKIAEEFGVDFEVDAICLATSINDCIERDLKRQKSVGERVIRQMYEQYLRPALSKSIYNPELDSAFIIDIDGTLTMGPKNRSPYEWKKVGNDDINTGLSHIIDGINQIGYARIFIFSGRDEICRPETEEWLERHAIDYDILIMRKKKDQRPDTIVKKEFYDEYVAGQYNVLGVFDDRPAVAEQWRQMGLNVFQCGSPYIWF